MNLIKLAFSRVPRKALIVGTLLLLAIIVEIVATLLIPTWRTYFFNILGAKQVDLFTLAIGYYILLIGILTLVQGVKTWLGQRLGFYFRTALTDILSAQWINSNSDLKLDNPCQRINQDAALCTDLTISTLLECVISGVIVIALIIETLSKPTIIYASLGYTAIVIVMALFFKNKLISTEIDLQKAEANHRLSLSEITLGNSSNLDKPNSMYVVVSSAYHAFITTMMNYTFFNRLQNNFATIVAYVLLAPAYFLGTMTLGEFMGDASMFDLVVINATILVGLFPVVTKSLASWRRIINFHRSLS